MRKIFLSVLPIALAAIVALPSGAFAQTEIVVVGDCQFDKDGIADSWRTSRKRGFFGLSAKSREKRLVMKRAWKHFTCRDKNNDGISEIVARMSEGTRRRQVIQVSSTGSGNLSKVCKSVAELKSCHIWKSQQSDHISRGDPRHRSTGFITLRGCPDSFPNPMFAYDSKGTQIHKLGEYFPSGSFYDSRHYGCYAAGDCKGPVEIAIEARRRTGKEDIYLKAESGTCYHVPDPGQCFNSSGC